MCFGGISTFGRLVWISVWIAKETNQRFIHSRISYPRAIVTIEVIEGIFYVYLFYIYVIEYLECSILEKRYYIHSGQQSLREKGCLLDQTWFRCQTTTSERTSSILPYHLTLLVFRHIMGIPDQDDATLDNTLFYSQHFSYEKLIHSCNIWIYIYIFFFRNTNFII